MDKAQIFAALAADVKEIEIKALGVMLKFQVLTGKARDAFHAAVSSGDGTNSFFEAAIVAATVVDDNHEPMFSQEDVETLQKAKAPALTEIAAAAMNVNKIGADAEAEAAKN